MWKEILMVGGGGGALALYWKNPMDVHVDSFSKYHIYSISNKGSDEA